MKLKICKEMARNDFGSCPVADFGISYIVSSDSAAKEFIN